MRKVIAAFAPLGRLYDPLLVLAQRVHRALTARRKTVWTDDRGSVFVNDVDLIRSVSPRSIVGTYDIRTPLVLIEADLRLALRERASNWIVDWNVSVPDGSHDERCNKVVRLRSRPRRKRTIFKANQSLDLVVQESGAVGAS